ncbi:MAG: sulfotransferase family 2 domain-containing protein [Gomphosphaeria aponina SAG 52.96 = DSM 107014]|uniref:Sulfotransferase family 2 domain-containing protein n=1 Tax=Gomphosphaeria aponina SAG 52.96 = DSM 107014 TaxID=1521640 RepID=A0A941JLK1_9CHRO|nr:sulfotransferase family 2 domain-containing protein [Gomphosphaeria aponina SAG 52.96 = DSM 107014]
MITVDVVQLSKQNTENLLGFRIDKPKTGEQIDTQGLKVAGWVLGKQSQAVAVELVSGTKVIKQVPLDRFRPKPAQILKVPAAEKCGFATVVKLKEILPAEELWLKAVLEDQSVVSMGVIKIQKQLDKSEGEKIVPRKLKVEGERKNQQENHLVEVETIKLMLGKGDVDGAIAAYEKARAQNPELVNQVLFTSARPLFSKEHKLGLFWSAKGGCTFAVKWYFYQIGLLETALEYHKWIHNYRQYYYQQENYQNELKEILNPETQTIKVVRNPYNRVVSSYIHVIKYNYEDQRIMKFLGRDVNKQATFSFREFIAYLESISLRSANEHHRLQVHLSEELGLVKPKYVVKLEKSFEELRQIEVELGLKESDLEALVESKHHTKREENDDEFCGDKWFERKHNVTVPSAKNFYDDELKVRVEKLYGVDLERYNYEMGFIS